MILKLVQIKVLTELRFGMCGQGVMTSLDMGLWVSIAIGQLN